LPWKLYHSIWNVILQCLGPFNEGEYYLLLFGPKSWGHLL
jgi:hypothetical protein